jgi:hypothetical protein
MTLREKTLLCRIDISQKPLDNSPNIAIFYLSYDFFSNEDGCRLTAEIKLDPDYSKEWVLLVKDCIEKNKIKNYK